MKKVINMLGFKVNKFNDWLRKNGKAEIDTKAQNASGQVLLKEPSGSSKSRQHLRVIK
ncbi:MAG: hypothetical protein ABI167_03060 [Nitrosospira sp.]